LPADTATPAVAAPTALRPPPTSSARNTMQDKSA
jgi:hypothetical protein